MLGKLLLLLLRVSKWVYEEVRGVHVRNLKSYRMHANSLLAPKGRIGITVIDIQTEYLPGTEAVCRCVPEKKTIQRTDNTFNALLGVSLGVPGWLLNAGLEEL